MRTKRAMAALAAVVAAVAIVASACTAGGSAKPLVSSAPAAPTGSSAAADLPKTEVEQPAEDCAKLAAGPWTNRHTDADLFAALRAGVIPPFIGDGDGLQFEVHEYPTVDSYEDPSTIRNFGHLRAAWTAAGYQEGVDWRHGGGGNVVAFTLVRFRDDGGARAALSALLDDYCSKAYSAKVISDRSGMTITRTTGAVRTMFVVDDTLVSAMTCACYGSDDRTRQRMIEDWASRALLALGEGKKGSSTT